MRRDHFNTLLDKYLSGTASPEEKVLLEEYYMQLSALENASPQKEEENIQQVILNKILEQLNTDPQGLPMEAEVVPMKRRKKRIFYAAAAVFTGLLFIGGYFLLHHDALPAPLARGPVALPLKDDLAPGGDKAVLTLANGERVILDTARGGAISQQGSASVIKQADGLLAYNNSRAGAGVLPDPSDIPYNTLATPRGGQYRLILSDGTKVWLNAASSLRYPAAFTGAERVVEITGEAYFEVEKNPAMPFKVKVNGAEVMVLGTSFNVMAYNDEAALNTTLLEGAVRISKGSIAKTLKPGQQASLKMDGGLTMSDDVDTDEVLAWKNNLFTFNDADIQSVMRQIGRWYDVDIKYAGNVSQHFNGNISRAVNVSKVFRMLELTGSVHFRIEGKEIVVSP